MLHKEPTIRPGLYRLPEQPVGSRILIPGFRSATSVRGAFGWFSASWISKLAPGLAEYLNRQDTTPIDFTVAPALFIAEREAIELAHKISPDEASQRVADVFMQGRVDASALGKHALDCLSWLVATGQLHLRIAVPTGESNYHPKVWLFDDRNHQVLARGSGNATGRGVAQGVEHMDVDVTWIDNSRKRVSEGIAMLNDWSRGRSYGIERVVELPEALEQDIIQTRPESVPNQDDYEKALSEDGNPTWATDPTEILRTRFAQQNIMNQSRLIIPKHLEWQTGAYAHQGEAVTAWESMPHPERGTISMATGAGKTITALICATRLQNRISDNLLIIISAPSIPILIQWQKEVLRFGIKAIAPSLERDVNTALTSLFRRLSTGGTQVLLVTNNLLCSSRFQSTVAFKINQLNVRTMFIADEAHTLGAEGFLNNKPKMFERRLAISATPERQYDPDGTEEIFAFMGPPIYEFGLDKAIGFCLSPYNYYVHAATLSGEELDEFTDLTRRIGKWIGREPDDIDEDKLTKLMIARRRIIETSQAKLSLLQAVLEKRQPSLIQHMLIYASAKNPDQFDNIALILKKLDIRWAPVTFETTANKKLLTETLDAFVNGGYQVLLAKKVLDEGIDLPNIREAMIVASSTVQREWVQRRGRLLRRNPGKPWAIVHDFLALPPAQLFQSESRTNMAKIIQTELRRAYAFAAHAQNATGLEGVLSDLRRISSVYWPVNGYSAILQREGDAVLASTTPEGTPW